MVHSEALESYAAQSHRRSEWQDKTQDCADGEDIGAYVSEEGEGKAFEGWEAYWGGGWGSVGAENDRETVEGLGVLKSESVMGTPWTEADMAMSTLPRRSPEQPLAGLDSPVM